MKAEEKEFKDHKVILARGQSSEGIENKTFIEDEAGLIQTNRL